MLLLLENVAVPFVDVQSIRVVHVNVFALPTSLRRLAKKERIEGMQTVD